MTRVRAAEATRLHLVLTVLCVALIPFALFVFLGHFRRLPDAGNDLATVAYLLWPVSCLFSPFLARFPARHGHVVGTALIGLFPPIYGALLLVAGA